MSGLLPAVPALVVVACLVLFVVGLRLLRSDAVDGLEVGDLALLRLEQRRDATGRGPLQPARPARRAPAAAGAWARCWRRGSSA